MSPDVRSIDLSAQVGPDADAARTLDKLYRRYSSWLAAKLTRAYGPRLVEDLVQETYIRFAPYQRGRQIRHPRALLWKIAQNLARNHYRRHGAREQLAVPWEEVDDEEIARDAPQFEALVFKQVVLQLPPTLRQVLLLSRFSGMTNPEIASCCGVSLATVERRLAKAMRTCAQHMAP